MTVSTPPDTADREATQPAGAEQTGAAADTTTEVSFDTHPDSYRHWRLELDGEIARLVLDVDENGGIVPGYELKLNS
ncbi:MAG: hypothetical protein GEV00_22270, partial [Actinophytocola sp.]|nr:hypothetical protein [Actinophytocola sp.]